MTIFNWTGNPWVDTGLAVAIVRANKRQSEELTLEDFKKVIGDGKWLIHANEHLNSYICLFANAFLNRQVKPKDKPAQRVKYGKIIAALLEDLERSFSEKVDSTNCCECTGIFPSANKTLALLTEQFRREGILKKDQRLDIGRNAFPLIGSITNDAGALPAASREPELSAFALLCVQIASLAAVMLKGKIAFFQYTEPSLLIPHVKSIYDDTIAKLNLIRNQDSASISAIGTGRGSQSTALILLDEFNRLKNILEIEELPEHVALNLWLLINSGTSFDCEVIEIPNAALKFLWEAATKFPDEIKGILRNEKSWGILDSIESRKEYMPFYPLKKSKPVPMDLISKAKKMLSSVNQEKAEIIAKTEYTEFESLIQSKIASAEDKAEKKAKKNQPKEKFKKERPKSILQLLSDEFKQNKKKEIKELVKQIDTSTSLPASKELFKLYQTNVLGRPKSTLSVAEWIAYNLKERLKDKKQLDLFIKNLGDLDFKDIKKCRSALRQVLGEFAEDGILSYEQYLVLFPIIGNKPIRVDSFGWRYIWFYLNHENLNSNSPQIMEDNMAIDSRFRQTIKHFAQDVFEWYVEKQGEEKFKKRILDGFRNNKIRDADLQRWFCNLGEIPGKENYTNEVWDELCRDENGASGTYELRFQLRLELANLYRKHISR